LLAASLIFGGQAAARAYLEPQIAGAQSLVRNVMCKTLPITCRSDGQVIVPAANQVPSR
jgi:hypothetical protein